MRLRNQMPAESRMVLPCRNPAPNLFGIGHNRNRADVRLQWERLGKCLLRLALMMRY